MNIYSILICKYHWNGDTTSPIEIRVFPFFFFSNTHHSFTPTVTSCLVPKASDAEQQKQWRCRWRLPLSPPAPPESCYRRLWSAEDVKGAGVRRNAPTANPPLHFRNKLTSDGTETRPNLEGRNVGCKPKGDSSRRLFIF